MISHKTTQTIQKPLDKVFKFVATDYFQNHPKWDPRVAEIKVQGPMVKGAKGIESRRQMNMVNAYDFEVTEYSPNRRMAFQATSRSSRYSMSFDFTGSNGKTELTLTAELSLGGMMRLFQWLIAGNFNKEIDRNARTIKTMIEST